MKGWRNTIRQHKVLRWILLFSNWFFQGIWNSDVTEKVYKVSFTAFFTVIFFILFKLDSIGLSFFIAFLIAHTLNWLVNCSVSGILVHRLFLWKVSKEKTFNYLKSLKKRTDNSDVICYCAVFGSIARGELKVSSDVDVGFLRKPGFFNALKGLFFITLERFRTNITGIPFEGYLVDSIEKMVIRFENEQIPVVLKQSELIKINGISLEKAQELNDMKII